MAKTKIQFHDDAYEQLLNNNAGLKKFMLKASTPILNEIEVTAPEAENAEDGVIEGYASAGFKMDVQHGYKRGRMRSRRMIVTITSKADEDTRLKIYFHTIARDGLSHMMKALDKFRRGL